MIQSAPLFSPMTRIILGISLGFGLLAEADDQAATVDTVIAVRRGESLLGIAGHFLPRSGVYTPSALADCIRAINGLEGTRLIAGQELRIPLAVPDSDSSPPGPGLDAFDDVRGLYATASVAGSQRIISLAEAVLAAGGNTVVFDIKDRPGDISYITRIPMAQSVQVDSLAPIRNPHNLVRLLHQRGINVVARISCFYDELMSRAHPELTPRDLQGGAWGRGWLDPSLPRVQNYLLALVSEVAGLSVDEIQLDYVRFPTVDDSEVAFAFDPDSTARHEVITAFVERVAERLRGSGTLLSADIFGVAAWGRPQDLARIGQSLPDLLPLLDVVSPMLYPSHFYGNFEGVENPVEYPYYFVHEGIRRLKPLAARYGVAVRPWVQAFPYRVPVFDETYVTEQLQAATDAGAHGWLLWHPASSYQVGLEAMLRWQRRTNEQVLDREPPLLNAYTSPPVGSDM
ncbi:MAG: putative glycoside hydrolase [Candidatus Latescibacterota bacterium]|nr:putative glycoside hydrolase [Candidatus Latescibacterota bacterium]